MTHRSTTWLRPIAFAGATAALIALWWQYAHASDLHAHLPQHLADDLVPLYAAPRVDPALATAPPPNARPYLPLSVSPVFDRFALAILVALGSTILVATAVARRWWTPLCLVLATLAVVTINASVARIPGGDDSLTEPFRRVGLEYYPDTRLVRDDPVRFIRDYPKLNRPGIMSQHSGTHPPGGVLFLYFGVKHLAPADPPPPDAAAARRSMYESLFTGRPSTERDRKLETAVWLAIGATALSILPTWWLARTIGGAAAARRLLPMYLCVPNVVLYGATSMDGVFMTFCLTAMAASIAATRRRWHLVWTPLLTIVAGVALWAATFMTFTAIAVPLLMGLYAVVAGLRDWRRGAHMLARCALVGVVFIVCQIVARYAIDYDLAAVAHAAVERDAYAMRDHIGRYNPLLFWQNLDDMPWWRETSLANAVAWLGGSGVALVALALTALVVVMAHGRVRSSGMACFAPAFALCMLIMATSTLFSLETERVWLYLTPVMLVVATSQFRGIATWTLFLTLSFAQVFWMETKYYVFW